jgi:hypothetical protein
VILEETMVSVPVGVHADAEHGDALGFQFLGHSNEGRNLFDAGGAPSGPKIQDHYLAAKLAQTDGAVGILDGEIRGGGTNAGGMRAAVAAGKQKQQDEGDKETRPTHKAIINDSRYGYPNE